MNMNCKFCNAELEENVSVCLACGKNQEETDSNKKMLSKKWRLAIAIVIGVLLVAVLVGAILYSMGIDILPRDNNIFYRRNYTVSDRVADKKSNEIVATLGNQTLTNGVLQSYYWFGVLQYTEYNQAYLAASGIDLSTPLNKLIYDEKSGLSYQQVFLRSALENWRGYAILTQLAEEAGFTLSKEQLDILESFRGQMEEAAKDSGYDDVNEYVKDNLFKGCTLEDYLNYHSYIYKALAYYDSLADTLTPTLAESEAYYTEHEEALKEKGFGKDKGYYYNVRHILVTPSGGTENDDGEVVYTDAEWEACRAAAQKVLDTYLSGVKTEESFAALATSSADPGSASNGGLYTELTSETSFVQEFKDWYLDTSRQAGDTGLVKSSYGYHVMYFSGNEPIWEHEVKSIILSERTAKILDDAMTKWPTNVNFKKVVLGYLDLFGM